MSLLALTLFINKGERNAPPTCTIRLQTGKPFVAAMATTLVAYRARGLAPGSATPVAAVVLATSTFGLIVIFFIAPLVVEQSHAQSDTESVGPGTLLFRSDDRFAAAIAALL